MDFIHWNSIVYLALLIQTLTYTGASEDGNPAEQNTPPTNSSSIQTSFSVIPSSIQESTPTPTSTRQMSMTISNTIVPTPTISMMTNTLGSTLAIVSNDNDSTGYSVTPSFGNASATPVSSSAVNIDLQSTSTSILPTTTSSPIAFSTDSIHSPSSEIQPAGNQSENQTTHLESINVSPLKIANNETLSVSATSSEMITGSSISIAITSSPSEQFSINSSSSAVQSSVVVNYSVTPSSTNYSEIQTSLSVTPSATSITSESINITSNYSENSQHSSSVLDPLVINATAVSSSVSLPASISPSPYQETPMNSSLSSSTSSIHSHIESSNYIDSSSTITVSSSSVLIDNLISTRVHNSISVANVPSSTTVLPSSPTMTSMNELMETLSGTSSTQHIESSYSTSEMVGTTNRLMVENSTSDVSINPSSTVFHTTEVSETLRTRSTSTASSTGTSGISSTSAMFVEAFLEYDLGGTTSAQERSSGIETVLSSSTTVTPTLKMSSSGYVPLSSSIIALPSSETVIPTKQDTLYTSTMTDTVTSSTAILELATTDFQSDTASAVTHVIRASTVSITPPLQTITDNIVASPSATLTETTDEQHVITSTATPTVPTVSSSVTPNQYPINNTTHGVGSMTRVMITFDGNCHLLKDSLELQTEFLKAWANDVATNTGLDVEPDKIEMEKILCDPFRIIMKMMVNDTNTFNSVKNDIVASNFYVRIPDSLRELNFSSKRVEILDDSEVIDGWGDVSVVGRLEVTDLVIIGVATFLFLVLVSMLVVVLCRECYIRKRSSSFSLTDVPHINLRLSDFTLTKIPRPHVIYRDNSKRKPDRVPVTRVDPISRSTNISYTGDRYDKLNKMSDNSQPRMRDHAYGLVVGVMGNRHANESMNSDKSNVEDGLSDKVLLSNENGFTSVGINNPTFTDNEEEVNGNIKIVVPEEEIEHFL